MSPPGNNGHHPTLSLEAANWLLWLVGQQTPRAGAPDFKDAVAQIVRAQDELEAIIAALAPSAG